MCGACGRGDSGCDSESGGLVVMVFRIVVVVIGIVRKNRLPTNVPSLTPPYLQRKDGDNNTQTQTTLLHEDIGRRVKRGQ